MNATDKKLKALERQIKSIYTNTYQEMKEQMASVLSKIELNPEMPLSQKMALMSKYDRLNKISEQLADVSYNANKYAKKMIDGEMVNIYGINYNESAERLGFSIIDNTAIKKILTQEENPFEKISSLYDKTGIKNQMKGQLMQGLLSGESIPKIARRLKNVSEKNLKDSIRIARTETTRVQNSAKMDIGHEGKRLGFEMWKRWIATNDTRTRGGHYDMNGVEVPLDEPFEVSVYKKTTRNGVDYWIPTGKVEKMMFPGDISMGASAENVINCRCTMIEFIKE